MCLSGKIFLPAGGLFGGTSTSSLGSKEGRGNLARLPTPLRRVRASEGGASEKRAESLPSNVGCNVVDGNTATRTHAE